MSTALAKRAIAYLCFLTISSFGLLVAQTEPAFSSSGSYLVSDVPDSGDSTTISLESVIAFDAEGGQATFEPGTASEETFTYSGIDDQTNALVGVTRTGAVAHQAGTFVLAGESSGGAESTEDPSSPPADTSSPSDGSSVHDGSSTSEQGSTPAEASTVNAAELEDPEDLIDIQLDLALHGNCTASAGSVAKNGTTLSGAGSFICSAFTVHEFVTIEVCIQWRQVAGAKWTKIDCEHNAKTNADSVSASVSTSCIDGTWQYRMRAEGKAFNEDGQLVHRDTDRGPVSTFPCSLFLGF